MKSAASYLIIFNIAKKSNIGNLLRTANAFGISEVLVVGKRRFHEFGAFGTSGATTKRHFYCLEDACAYVRSLGCTLCGVEIADEAVSICRTPFRGDTAFMVGNEGTGLSPDQRKQCDYLVYIPQFGSGASLNVNVATGIVLQRFAEWAGWKENDRQHEKFTRNDSSALNAMAEPPHLTDPATGPESNGDESPPAS